MAFMTAATLVFCLAGSIVNAEWIPSRRASPTKTESGSLFFPVYAHIPGIGSTYGAGLLVQNIDKSRTSILGIGSFGDTSTAILGLNEVNFVLDHVVANFYAYSTGIPFQNYVRGTRGAQNGYFYQFNKESGGTAYLKFLFLQRRLYFDLSWGASQLKYAYIAASDGTRYSNADASSSASIGGTYRMVLDFTDESADPRRGLNLQVIRDNTTVFDRLHSDFYTLNYMATAYFPVFKSSTWAFNAFRSSAFVSHKNTLTAAQLQTAMSLNCSTLSDPAAQSTCQNNESQRAQSRSSENTYGTAGLLGGPTQLRGFPYGRFAGSQSLFYATELRLNVIEGNSHVDLGFFRGALSFLQISPFYELGAVSDPPQPVESVNMRSAAGVGFRVGFSGAVVRADVGYSNEGSQFTVFVGYPWDLPPF